MRRLYLHVFAEGARVCVGLVAHFAEIRFVRRVDVHVFLAVTAVCKPPVAAFEFTLKRLLACTRTWTKHTLEITLISQHITVNIYANNITHVCG